MSSIRKKGERKYKITVCNGYRPGGQKRCQSRTIDVPEDIPKRGITQYVYAEAQKFEKKFRYGIEEDDRTTFENYAESWLRRQVHYKPSTLAAYRRLLEVVYPWIGGVPLYKIRPMVLEELCAELRKRKGQKGHNLSENTVHKYLDAVSAVLQDALRNDIILYNPAHRVRGLPIERKIQRIPNDYEMKKLLECILQQPLIYRTYYLLALSTGMRRGEICALRWNDLHASGQVMVRHSRSSVPGQGIVETSPKNHRIRVVVIPDIVHEYLGELLREQAMEGLPIGPQDYIFATKGGPIHPDSFTRRLRKMYKNSGLSEEYHLHTLRHFFATYLLQNNTSKQVTADLLGHADTAFLERTYCHPQLEVKQQAASILEQLLRPSEEYDDGQEMVEKEPEEHPKAQ